MEQHYKQKSVQQRPTTARNSHDDMTIVVVGSGSGSATPTGSTTDMHAAAEVTASTIVVPAAAQQSRPRTYYVDWLRLFLTVLVLCHHCVTSYQSSQVWKAKRGDTALWLLSMLFVYGNQAYFMTLFFFLSGLYVPGSYKRKGPLHFVFDRTLRLVIPCMFYSMLIAPLLIWWGQAAAHDLDPVKFPRPTVGQAFAAWYAPGWPSRFNLPTGPPWFVWMLWCFNVAYVTLRLAVDSVRSRLQSRRSISSTNLVEMLDSSNSSCSSSPKSEYTTRQWLVGGAALTGVLFVLQYAVRAFDMYTFNIRPGQFVTRGPFVSFMPDYFVAYVVAFALGTFSGPAGWDVLARLPSGMSAWLLSISGIWWTLFGFVPNVMLNTYMSGQLGAAAFLGTWLLRTLVEQSFAVGWSMGLLILFRQAFNVRPNWFGKQVIGAAYGAYIIHWPFVALFSRALMSLPAPSAVINAACITPPVVVCAFMVAALARAIPGADRIL